MSDATEANYLAAASALLGLPIRSEDAADVAAQFAVITAQARLVSGFALPEDIEAAPHFSP